MQRPPQPLFLTRQLRGIEPPPGVKVPTLLKLVKVCSGSTFGPISGAPYIRGVAYPPENPTVWIKHTCSTAGWNGVSAQIMAYNALRKMGSTARVPGIYRAYELYNKWTYVVMEYIPDETAFDLKERTKNPFKKAEIHDSVAHALGELYHIPIPDNAIPTDIHGVESVKGFFHVWNKSKNASCKNVGVLEKRINKLLKRFSNYRVDFSGEPMAFCYDDFGLENFLIGEDNRITVVGFTSTKILPISFAKLALDRYMCSSKFAVTMRVGMFVGEWRMKVNTNALLLASGRLSRVQSAAESAAFGIFPPVIDITNDEEYLRECLEKYIPVPPFDRFIYVLPHRVIKKQLSLGETGFNGYIPDFATLSARDDNELKSLELVREHTDIPVPRVLHQGKGFNVFERIYGITVNEKAIWDRVSSRQREAIRLQVQGYIKKLATIPNPTSGIRSLVPSGEVFHLQLPEKGPFASTQEFVAAYKNHDVLGTIPLDCQPVFSHLDWDLSNLILYPNLDAVAGVIDWERACFFPEGGRSIHKMCHQWDGWEKLFDGLDFPRGST